MPPFLLLLFPPHQPQVKVNAKTSLPGVVAGCTKYVNPKRLRDNEELKLELDESDIDAATALTNQIIAEEAAEPTEEDATVLDSPPPLMEMFEPAGNATGGINLGELIPGTRRDGGGKRGV